MSWGKLYGYNDAGRNTKMLETMIPTPVQKPYLFDGTGYDTIDEMQAAKDKAHGVQDSAFVKWLRQLNGDK